MLKAFKYRLYPTNEQKILLEKHFGCVRFIYNLALETKINAYSSNRIFVSRYDLQEQLVDLKNDASWLKEVNSQSLQSSLLHLDNAYTHFFKFKKGFPKFKSKHHKNSFSVPQGIKIFDRKIFIPKFLEGIKIVIDRKHEGTIRSGTVSKTPSQKYFISILCETGVPEPDKKLILPETTIGIDLGLKSFLTLSNGEKVDIPNFDKKSDKLKILQRKLSKRIKGSNRFNVIKLKISKVHESICNIRKDFQHKLSTEITNRFDTIVIENLNVKGMMRNHKLANSIQKVSWSEFTSMLEYKSKWKGKNLKIVNRFFPSSKLCSICGYKKDDLTLKDREWICPCCNTHHDRDLNAAINIKNHWLAEYQCQNVETIPVDGRLNLLRPKKHIVDETLIPIGRNHHLLGGKVFIPFPLFKSNNGQ